MKLLIVDDEDLTREGLVMNIDWGKLGIDHVFTADDGIHGIELTQKHKPEIILSDVRMPRMDGIAMANEVRTFHPSCTIIFMSGYSDKEYLKSAIKLKAISYVEKPIDLAEITAAIQEAVVCTKEMLEKNESLSFKNQISASQLALMLTYPSDPNSQFRSQLEELFIPIKTNTHYTTLLIQLSPAVLAIHQESHLLPLYQDLSALAKADHFWEIHGMKQDNYLIFHLIHPDRMRSNTISKVCSRIQSHLSEAYQMFITVGKTVSDPSQIYQSYNSAVILLQVAFFIGENAVLYEDNIPYTTYKVEDSFYESFEQSLKNQNLPEAKALLTQLYDNLYKNPYTLVNYVKDVYLQLMHTINSTAHSLYINILEDNDSYDSMTVYVSSCLSLTQLQNGILDKLNRFFTCLSNKSEETSTVTIIKNYISKHYDNEQLSVKDISEHVYLSSSYVCTVFKNETGQTLNQYITAVRVEKAKSLLTDPRNKITDISSKVGYSDSNYFSKAFKKITNQTPTEYREQYLT